MITNINDETPIIVEMILLTSKRVKVIAAATAFLIIGLVGILHYNDYTLPLSLVDSMQFDTSTEDSLLLNDVPFFKDKPSFHLLWSRVFGSMYVHGPRFDNVDEAIKYTGKKTKGQSKSELLSRADISPSTIDELHNKHKAFVDDLLQIKPTYGYKKGTTGVVMIGGGRYSWLSYLSLLSLRETGCTLPVEVIIPKYSDYEKEMEFCYTILPHHNAKCVVVSEVLGPSVMMKNEFHSYQYKGLALLVTSFQNVLMLDSDNMMVRNPESIFSSELFKKYGLITWPDYWKRTISPEFYKIASLKVDENKRVRFSRFPLALDHNTETEANVNPDEIENIPYAEFDGAIPNLSTESGQLFFNKDIHWHTILLSMYYNIHGPKLYYRLFSLGAQGEGDKETFTAAASVLGKKYYQVYTPVATLGYSEAKGKFQGVGMIQKDPLQDYEAFQTYISDPIKSGEMGKLSIPEQIEKLKEIEKKHFGEKSGSPWTLHCNFPKLDPIDLTSKEDIFDKDENHMRYRLYGNHKAKNTKGESFDFELHQWSTMERIVCRQKFRFPYLDKFKGDICVFLRKQVEFLEKNPIG